MWLLYEVKKIVYPIMEKLCDMFINYSEKDVKIVTFTTTKGNGKYYYKVSKDSCMTKSGPRIKVEGVIGLSNYKLRSVNNGFIFSADNCYDAEGLFFDLLNLLCFYSSKIKYDGLDLNMVYEMTEEEGPVITPTNYVAFTDNYIGPLLGIFRKFYKKCAHHEMSGKFAYTIYDDKAKKFFPDKDRNYFNRCKKFISKFKELYFFDDVMLVCIRVACVQYIYYLVNGSSLYYNSEDGSRAVIEKYYKRITNSLSKFGNNRELNAELTDGFRQFEAEPLEIYKDPY